MSREAVMCPICGQIIWSGSSEPIISRASIPTRAPRGVGASMLTAMAMAAEQAHLEKLAIVEQACLSHFETKHARRFRIARRFGWEWLMKKRWPWSRIPNFNEFEVKA